MSGLYSDDFVTIYHGDAWELAPTLAPQSIHAIVTSPPYFGLRDYGEPGQFGLESTPGEYVAKLVDLFALLRPALRDDGTVWLNLGDSFMGGGGGNYGSGLSVASDHGQHLTNVRNKPAFIAATGLKAKDLVGIPWRVALALQADGWYLRSDIIWHKPNPMPESVTDRPTKAHEYVFLLAKSQRYHYDHDAIKEPSVYPEGSREDKERGDFDGKWQEPGKEAFRSISDTRNKRSVWTIPTKPFSQAHFAVFPPDLIRPCILAGAPERCCPECGTPWERIVEKESHVQRERGRDASMFRAFGQPQQAGVTTTTTTTGWLPACTCGHEPIGGTVLDPFMGSGTTAQVARSLGRKAVGFELNEDYIEIAAKHRLAQGVLL